MEGRWLWLSQLEVALPYTKRATFYSDLVLLVSICVLLAP